MTHYELKPSAPPTVTEGYICPHRIGVTDAPYCPAGIPCIPARAVGIAQEIDDQVVLRPGDTCSMSLTIEVRDR